MAINKGFNIETIVGGKRPSPTMLDSIRARQEMASLKDALGGKTMTTAEFERGEVPQDSLNPALAEGIAMPPGMEDTGQTSGFDAALQQQASAERMRQAATQMGSHLKMLEGTGAASMYAKQALEESRSKTERKAAPPKEFIPPTYPGSVYLNHLFERTNGAEAMKEERQKALTKGTQIFTDHSSALKTAIAALGVFSERNPTGLPIEIKDAKKIWFGTEEVDRVAELEWRTKVEMGENNADPKKVRQFVNYDGSRTWELLNEDKTVMSRFTLGELDGMKVFVQGGYNKFAEKLAEARAKGLGRDPSFDAQRRSGM